MKTISPSYWKEMYLQSIDKLFEHKDLYFENPEKAFSRTQKISLWDTMLFPMVADNCSTAIELLDYFTKNDLQLDILPSQAAMSYRRDQLKVSAYKDVFTDFTSKIPQKKTFHGLQVIACDGTRLNTPYNPKDLNSFVNHIEGRKGFNQYHLTTCYDVLNEVFTDAVIQGYHSMNEKLALSEMMDRCGGTLNLLFVADRGFASYNVVAHAVNNGHNFLIRLTKPMAKKIFFDTVNLDEVETCDLEDTFYVGRVRNKNSKALSNYHFVSNEKKYDYVPVKSEKIDQFHARLVKFTLPGGNTEYLLTNLPKKKFTISDLKELYRLRWEIETSFRHLKYASGMVHMHSIKPKFIFQEIFAKLTLYNFCTAVKLCTHVKSSKQLKHNYVIEKTYLIKTCIRYLKDMLSDIITLIEKRKVPVRAGRSSERNIRRQHADTMQYR